MGLFLLMRIIRRIMQASAFLSLNSPSGNEICGVNHIAELTYIPCSLHALEKFLRLLIEYVETCPCPLQTEVGAHYTDIVCHYLAYLLHTLGDEHFFFVSHSTLIVPFRYEGVEIIFINVCKRMAGCRLCINHSLDE